MANKKFSDFTLKTNSSNVDFLVGYDGSDNVRIAPSNISGGGGGSSTDTFVYNFSGTHTTNNTSLYYQFRSKSNSTMVSFNEAWTTANSFYYVQLTVPVACFLKKVVIKNLQTTPSCTQSRIKIFKNETTLEYQGSYISWTGAGAEFAKWEETLTSSNTSFAAGDIIAIGIQSDGTMGGVAAAYQFEIT